MMKETKRVLREQRVFLTNAIRFHTEEKTEIDHVCTCSPSLVLYETVEHDEAMLARTLLPKKIYNLVFGVHTKRIRNHHFFSSKKERGGIFSTPPPPGIFFIQHFYMLFF